jgi:hypothetical protein
VVTAVLLLQLAAAGPPGLETARVLLEAGDTVAAARVLGDIATRSLAPEALAALTLLPWIGRGAVDAPAVRQWKQMREPHLRLWRDVRRGAVAFGDRATEAVGAVLYVQSAREAARPDSLISWHLDPRAQPADWRVVFDSVAAVLDDESPLAAAGLRWVRVRELLDRLDEIAADAPRVPSCADCLQLGDPPPWYRLYARWMDAGQDSAIGTLAGLLTDLQRAPWPFNALGARAHVVFCALTRLTSGIAGCWPDGEHLEGREAAEVRAMVFAFRGQHGNAWQVMEGSPGWFAPLDSLRDLLEAPEGVARLPRGDRYSPSLPMMQDAGRRLSVATLWKAAWPFYLLPYNERLVVHRARLLLADVVWRLASEGRHGLFEPVGVPRNIVAVGVPLGVAIAGDHGQLLAYYPEGTHETAPQSSAGRGVGAGSPSAVPLDLALVAVGSRGTRLTGFVSQEYQVFGPLDHQIVQYVREGHRHADVHTMWSGPACPDARPLVGLFLLDTELRELSRTVRPELEAQRRLQFRLMLAPGMYVYSLELLDRGCGRAERARYVLEVPPATGATLSDLVLADELHYGDDYRGVDRLRERPPVTVRPSLSFDAGATARFYWEIYGVGSDTLAAGRLRVVFEIVNVRQERVAVRDLALVARQAAGAKPSLGIGYDLPVPPGTGPLATGLAVGLPEGTRGVHIARVRVTDTVTGVTATAQRAFFVRG